MADGGGAFTHGLKARQIDDDKLWELLPYNDSLHPREAQKVLEIMRHKFQQAINCCQTTALAYAFNVLGYKVSPDDIFSTLELDIDTVIRQGLSLAETHEMALRFISRARLPVFVEAYHFDEHLAITDDLLWEVCNNDLAANDVLIVNFHSGVAHARPDGGGHFALLAGCIPEGRELVVSDVHPLKYGAHWAAPVGLMRKAMSDLDSCGRARGILRLGRTDEETERPLKGLARADTLLDWISPPKPYVTNHFQRYIPKAWKSHVGALNLEGVSALALACRVLGETGPQVQSIDAIMRSLGASYTQELNRFASADHVLEFLKTLDNSGALHARAYGVELPHPLTAGALRTILKDAGCGSGEHVVLTAFDLGVAFDSDYRPRASAEANVLSHGAFSWGVVADMDPGAGLDDRNGLVIASAHHMDAVGRLWKCSLEAFARAISATPGATRLIVLSAVALDDQRTKLEKILGILDRNHDGRLTADDLVQSLAEHGINIRPADAQAVVEATAHDRPGELDHAAAIEMLVHALAFRPEHAQEDHPKNEALKAFLETNGCVDNSLGYATTHMALLTSDVRRCIEFYNGVLGWPLYKTVDRPHAGVSDDALGSSWASFGAFASFTVFHLWKVPPGREGHGPWASLRLTPRALRPEHDGPRKLALAEIGYPFLGVVLSQRFYALQMKRIRAKGPEVIWAEVTDAKDLLGAGEAESAIVFRDPDGYPLIFFRSARTDEDYAREYPVAPFVYGTEIRAAAPDAHDRHKKRHGDLTHIATCPVIASYRQDPRRKPLVERWLKTFAYGKDSAVQHREYYESVMGARTLTSRFDPHAKTSLTAYGWNRHFLITRTNTDYIGPMAADDGEHNMGGNKGNVQVPHFGMNLPYERFAEMRTRVQDVMKAHGVPQDLCESFSRMGHAPTRNLLDSYHFLFADDPDLCLSMFVCDPSGNLNEVKWYLDFGEMFKEQGSLGLDGYQVDNSMVLEHFPPEVLKMMEQRALRGDQEGLEVLHAELDAAGGNATAGPTASAVAVAAARRPAAGARAYLLSALATLSAALVWPILGWAATTAAVAGGLMAVFARPAFTLSADLAKDAQLLQAHAPLAAFAAGGAALLVWLLRLGRHLTGPRAKAPPRAERGLARWSGAWAFAAQVALVSLAFAVVSLASGVAVGGSPAGVSLASVLGVAGSWLRDGLDLQVWRLAAPAPGVAPGLPSGAHLVARLVFRLALLALALRFVWTLIAARPPKGAGHKA